MGKRLPIITKYFTIIPLPIGFDRPKTSTLYRNVETVLQGLLCNVLYFGHLRGFEAFYLPIGRIAVVSHISFNPGGPGMFSVFTSNPIRSLPDHLPGGL